MPRYRVAYVRFSPQGRPYPVNCRWASIKAGGRVVVRMANQTTRLQHAEVTGIGFSKSPCKNSIVCPEEFSSEYGEGPEGVNDQVTLHRFLMFLGWKSYFAVERHRGGLLTTPLFDYPVAYIMADSLCYRNFAENDRILGPAQTLHLGCKGLAYRYWDDRDSIEVANGHLVLNTLFMRKFDQPDHYYEAAKWAEGDLAKDLERPVDTSTQQIRSAISPDGGAAYLSDGEWL